MDNIKKRILYSRDDIEIRVRELAQRISRDYEGRNVVLVGILKGAFIFLADLSRCLKIPYIVDFARLASYGSSTVSSGTIKITKDIETSLEGKDVILVEDIVDTGTTIAFFRERLWERNPRSIKTCALIDKKERREIDFEVDYAGFTVETGFIVGYGLDYDERFRCMPDIYVIEE